MKVLLATGNPAKKERYQSLVSEFGYEVLSLKDVNIKVDIDESGNNPLENALIKARAYYKESGIPTIAQDDGLFIDKFSDDKQPGTHVRRVNGKELNDDEMIEYYTKELEKVGGKSKAKWVRGLVFIDENAKEHILATEDETLFVSKPCEKREVGYPLSSIGFKEKLNKYTVEMTKEEAEKEWKEYYSSIRNFFRNLNL